MKLQLSLKTVYFLIFYKLVYINKKPKYINNEDGFERDERGYYLQKRVWLWILLFFISVFYKWIISLFIIIWRQWIEINTYQTSYIQVSKPKKGAKLTIKEYINYVNRLKNYH